MRFRKKGSKHFDGYQPVIIFDNTDNDWIAYIAEMESVSAFGSTPEAALNELQIAWNEVKESYKEREEALPPAPSKKNYSGQFNVRVGKNLHRELAIEASRDGISLNALVTRKLSRKAS